MPAFPSLDSVCASLRKRSHDPRLLLIPGLSDELIGIAAAFGELREQVHVMARFQLAKHYGYDVGRSDYDFIVALAKEGNHVESQKPVDWLG